jgi:protein O-mannosyl-transferase
MPKKKQVKIKSSEAIEVGKGKASNLPDNYMSTVSFIKQYWIHCILIVILSFVIYGKSIQYDYILDDLIVIQENNFTKKGFAGIYDIFTTESFTGYFGEKKDLVQGNRYRPLSIVTFAMEYGISGGFNPKLSHSINILLYALSCILILKLLLLFLGKKYQIYNWLSIPIMATFLFLLHPLHVEAVANIKGRDEIMAMMFSLWSLYFFYRYAYRGDHNHLIWGNIMLFLGLLSKENAISFLAVIPLSIYVFTNKSLWESIRITATPLLTTVVYLILRFSVAGVPEFGKEITDIMNNPFYGMNGAEKYATIMYTLGLYISKLVFPHPLSHDYYPYAIPIMNWGNQKVLFSLLGYVLFTWIGLKYLKKENIVSWSILFYLSTLAIVSNVVINLGTFMNERFIYMSSLGFVVLLAFGLWKISEIKVLPGKNIIALLLFASVCSAYTLRSYTRVPDWENAVKLNDSAVEASPNSARANSFMATAYFKEYQAAETEDDKRNFLSMASPFAEKAVSIIPDYKTGNTMVTGIAAEFYKMDRDIDRLLQKF